MQTVERNLYRGGGLNTQGVSLQLGLSPDLFTPWAVACSQTGRESKCQVCRLCGAVPTVTFEPRTTGRASPWGGRCWMSWFSVCAIWGGGHTLKRHRRPCHLEPPFFPWPAWAGEGQENRAIQRAPFGAMPEGPSLRATLSGYFSVRQACVAHLPSASLVQAARGMRGSVVRGVQRRVLFAGLRWESNSSAE